ncbi:MAG: endonuclease/exonuclease/phosphatase family protein [Phototrophicaceae bacterium]
MTEKPSKIHQILPFFADIYGFCISLLLIIWLLTGERLFFSNIFVSLMPAIFYGIPFVLLFALWRGRLRTGAFLILPIIGFLVLYAPAFVPRTVPTADGIELSLLTYNLRASNTNTAQLDTILAETDADIVSLQEASSEISDWVEVQWAEEYPYQIRFTVEDENPEYAGALTLLVNDIAQYAGRLFLSRYPIDEYEIVPSSIQTTLYIRAELDINGRNVTVYNIHLPPPLPVNIFSTNTRHEGLVDILQVAQSSETVILMGDFNMTDQSEDYRLISSEYTDVFSTTSSGLGTTWANGNNLSPVLFFIPSLIRIDYMFVSDNIIPQFASVIRGGVSDHYPLYTEVVLD